MRPAQPVYARSLRVRADLPGALALPGHAPEPVRFIDLNARGAFAETRLRARPGTLAGLVLELPDGPIPIRAEVVRRSTALREADHPDLDRLVLRAAGLGLRFTSLAATDRGRLEQLLEALQRS